MQGFMAEDHWSRNECPVRVSERPTGGVWRTQWGVPPVSEGKPYRTGPGEPVWRYKTRNRNKKKKYNNLYPVEAERVLYAGDGKDIVIFMTKSESGWMQVNWSYFLNIESWDGNIVQQKLIFVIWKLILHDRNWKYNF